MISLKSIRKIRPYMLVKGVNYLRHYGPKEFMIRLLDRLEPEEVPYMPWYEKHRVGKEELKKQSRIKFGEDVKISIVVPVFHTRENYLRQMISSVRMQSYRNWELCIANAAPDNASVNKILDYYRLKDKRIKVRNLNGNEGIAQNTNLAAEIADGSYIGFLDHDDLLASDALYEAACRINSCHPDIIYSDEDKIRGRDNEHFQPHFKPDFNIDLLRSNNYICHFLIVKKELFLNVGGFREGFEGAQDHDFILRCVEKADVVSHIPRILYHWRAHRNSTSDNPDSKKFAYEAGVRAVSEHLKRLSLNAKVVKTPDYGFYKVEYIPEDCPFVSVIIPNKDEKNTLEKCINSVLKKNTYDNFEIIIVENNSRTDEIFDYYKELEKDCRIRVIEWNRGFNFSSLNNFAVKEAKGEYLLFLNNDIEVMTRGWIEKLLGNAQRADVGAVGCKLYYPDKTIQHAGVIIGMGGIAGHAFLHMNGRRKGYMNRSSVQMDYSAVTAACMMVPSEVFKKVGGFDEKLAVAFNDIDLCLKIRESGYLVVYDAYVEMIHYESKTRGPEDTDEKAGRFYSEIELMRKRWRNIIKNGDPCYNPNLTLSKSNYSLGRIH